MTVQLIGELGIDPERTMLLARQWQITSVPDANLALVITPSRLELRKLNEPKLGAVFVDFTQGTLAHRSHFGGGRGEAVVKAVGVKGRYLPFVIDATAGLGRDAFVLAAVGCQVLMFERNPVVAALLDDGLQRGYRSPEIGSWLQQRLTLRHISGLDALNLNQQLLEPDVVYLDPMFPHRVKSALVKKEMRILQELVGIDEDADSLLTLARTTAKKRVVVKRPNYAPPLANIKPPASLKTKNHRFDLYPPL